MIVGLILAYNCPDTEHRVYIDVRDKIYSDTKNIFIKFECDCGRVHKIILRQL